MVNSPDCSYSLPTRSSSSLAMCIMVGSPGVPSISGGELIEVISSPMSLVDRLAEGSWEEAPNLFPPFALSGVVMAPVHTLAKETFSPIASHFLTLEFSATGARVHMSVRLWPAGRHGSSPGAGFGETVYQRFLH